MTSLMHFILQQANNSTVIDNIAGGETVDVTTNDDQGLLDGTDAVENGQAIEEDL